MAKLGGFLKKFTGTIGNVTFKQLNGQTVVSEKVEAKANPKRSYAQMVRRVQWANLVNIYRAFGGNLHPSFENKAATVSDFNEFMSANFGTVPVYLTKGDARQGGCVVGALQVTRGSLPSIVVTKGTGDVPMTDISLGSLNLGNSTTVKDFSDAVLANNNGYQDGDQITCFVATQTVNAESGVPYVKVDAYELTLDTSNDDDFVRDLVSAAGFSSLSGHLAASATVDGAIAWVHSRKTATGTKVSTQRFVVSNSHLATYTSEAALAAAILSYGGTMSDQFLTPNVEGTPAVANTTGGGTSGGGTGGDIQG